MPAAVVMAALLVVSGIDGSAIAIDLSMRSEGRSRTTVQSALPPDTVAELALQPRAGFSLDRRTFTLGLAYEPQVLFLDIESGVQPDVLQRGSARMSAQLDPDWTLELRGDAGYGVAESVSLTQPAGVPVGGPLQAVPTVPTVHYFSGSAAAGLSGRLSPRQRWSSLLTFSSTGGLGADEVTLPTEQIARAAAAYEWQATHLDSLATSVNAGGTSVDRVRLDEQGNLVAGRAVDVRLEETWRRRTSASSDLWLGGGCGFVSDDQARPLGEAWYALPIAEAGAAWRPHLPGVATMRASALLAPVVDRFSGLVYDRVDGLLVLEWNPARILRLDASLSGGVVVTGVQRGDRVLAAEARGSWRVDEGVDFGAGVRGNWQTSSTLTPSDIGSVGLFLALTYTHREKV